MYMPTLTYIWPCKVCLEHMKLIHNALMPCSGKQGRYMHIGDGHNMLTCYEVHARYPFNACGMERINAIHNQNTLCWLWQIIKLQRMILRISTNEGTLWQIKSLIRMHAPWHAVLLVLLSYSAYQCAIKVNIIWIPIIHAIRQPSVNMFINLHQHNQMEILDFLIVIYDKNNHSQARTVIDSCGNLLYIIYHIFTDNQSSMIALLICFISYPICASILYHIYFICYIIMIKYITSLQWKKSCILLISIGR